MAAARVKVGPSTGRNRGFRVGNQLGTKANKNAARAAKAGRKVTVTRAAPSPAPGKGRTFAIKGKRVLPTGKGTGRNSRTGGHGA